MEAHSVNKQVSLLIRKGVLQRRIMTIDYDAMIMVDDCDVITDRLPMNAFESGFLKMNEGSCGKVVLDWR